MSSITNIIKKLEKNPEQEYGLSEITQKGLFPWTKDIKNVSAIVARDLKGANLLKAEITGKNQGRRYVIKAKNIIKFLEVYGPGLMIG